jgi:hypothetical protein
VAEPEPGPRVSLIAPTPPTDYYFLDPRLVLIPAELWRMSLRYLIEYVYLEFSAMPDPRTFFWYATSFHDDFVVTGIVDGDHFDALVRATAAVCHCYAIDESRFRFAPA